MKRKKINENQFRHVPNLNDYILQNQLQMRQASKFQRINAIQAKGGERINTIASDGTQETTNVANAGDWIVNNVSNPNNKWIINAQTFAKKYQPDPSHPGVYMPKGGPMNAAQINEPISFTAPWGEQMNIDKGGYILQDPNNPNDVYGISGPDFDNTYRFNESKKSKKKTINEAQLRRMIGEAVKNIYEGWRFNSPREQWVEDFGEEYVQRLESPLGELLDDAEKELGEVINFGRDYDGTSENPIGWLSCYYCRGDISEKDTLRKLISILQNYDMICVNEDGTVDVNESNHQELANRINQLIGNRISESQLRNIIGKSLKGVLKENDDAYSMFPYQSDIFRYAYNHQTVRSKLDDVYRLVGDIAGIASSEGRDNYAQFYGKLKKDLAQVYRLWDFLDKD